MEGGDLDATIADVWPERRRKKVDRCVSIGHTSYMSTKDSGFRIRVQRDLREKFLDACRAQDKPAAQVIREFMRDYVDQHQKPTGVGHSPARKRGPYYDN